MGEKINFTVPIPEAGDGTIITFSNKDLRELCSDLRESGVTGLVDLVDRLDRLDLDSLPVIARFGVKGGNWEKAADVLSIEELAGRLMDALLLRIKGRTRAELAEAPKS